MSNLSEFRKNEFLQLEYALATGRSVTNLLDRSKEMHGNTQFNSFLQSTCSSTSPIDWLAEDECLNASVATLRNSAKVVAELEDNLDMPYLDILKKFERKHATSNLFKLFENVTCDKWGEVNKGEIKPLLEEFKWWCSYIDELDLDIDTESATSLLEALNKPIFKQVKKLVGIAELSASNWDLDVPIFESIVKELHSCSANFVSEWLTNPNPFEHYNAKTHREYKSIYSWFFLSLIAHVYQYKSNMWATKKQWQAMGYSLKDNARLAPVFHYFKVDKKDEVEDDFSDVAESSFGRKLSIVYNADEVIGFAGKDYENTKVASLPILEQRIQELEIDIKHTQSGHARYFLDADCIEMPEKTLFKGKESTKAYYATLLHEMVHWTGHESRCKRTFGCFGDPKYSFEELVAEIGSAFLCNRFGLTKNVRTNSINYISGWLNGLNEKDTAKSLETAAKKANRASNYIYRPDKK